VDGGKRKNNMGTKWNNDSLQFPRFIAEAEAAGAFKPSIIRNMAESMDLQEKDVVELIDRAQAKWDYFKIKS